jgi:hypothetical protein
MYLEKDDLNLPDEELVKQIRRKQRQSEIKYEIWKVKSSLKENCDNIVAYIEEHITKRTKLSSKEIFIDILVIEEMLKKTKEDAFKIIDLEKALSEV